MINENDNRDYLDIEFGIKYNNEYPGANPPDIQSYGRFCDGLVFANLEK